MKITLDLIILISLFCVGLYLVVANWDKREHHPRQRATRRRRRYIGYALLIGALGYGIYLWYNKSSVFSASMPNDECKSCQVYIKRAQGLQPYRAEEFQQLKNHARDCNVCSNMCFDYIQLLERYPPQEAKELPNYRKEVSERKKSCAETTKYAMRAKKELDRLSSKMRANQARIWASAQEAGGRPTWNPFPEVPRGNP